MSRTTWSRTAATLTCLALATTACGTTAGNDAEDTAASGPVSGLRVMVPNSPGSGYDQTARAATKAMEDGGLAETVEVFNVAGAGGTVGLQRLANEKGNGDLLMQMGLGVVGAEFTNNSQAKLAETTPIAGLIEEAEVIVVPKDSPYTDLKSLTDAWKADPGKLPVGGASNPGGPDHLTPMLLAEEVGVDPKSVNYIPYDGGGELLAGILGKKLAFAATGVSEVAEQAKAGELTILAVTSEEPVEGVDAPTLQDEGIDLTFTNWRGIVAAPDISDADRTRLTDLVTEMHGSPEWKKALEENGWTDAFMSGDEFESFLTSESERVRGVLSGLGLA
jgi:putative tricarboxylic transport membrane protein